MIPLSVVIITYNEEKNIGRCLDSVKEIADEVVVVDSLSTDRTQEICREKGTRVIEQAFLGYIEQKNFALTQTKHPFVLSLDADEALSEELKQSILEVKQNRNADGYTMNRLTNYCGQWIRHCGWYPDTKLRLWDKHRGLWVGINPHDRFEMDNNATINYLKGDLLHYSYYTLEEHYRQAKKFSTIAAAKVQRTNRLMLGVKIIIKPAAKFIRNYIVKQGFRDGKSGFTICRISAYETYMKYSKAYRLQFSGKKNPL
jgi:glycosyltransferase involved in cell wall biosynthesis